MCLSTLAAQASPCNDGFAASVCLLCGASHLQVVCCRCVQFGRQLLQCPGLPRGVGNRRL